MKSFFTGMLGGLIAMLVLIAVFYIPDLLYQNAEGHIVFPEVFWTALGAYGNWFTGIVAALIGFLQLRPLLRQFMDQKNTTRINDVVKANKILTELLKDAERLLNDRFTSFKRGLNDLSVDKSFGNSAEFLNLKNDTIDFYHHSVRILERIEEYWNTALPVDRNLEIVALAPVYDKTVELARITQDFNTALSEHFNVGSYMGNLEPTPQRMLDQYRAVEEALVNAGGPIDTQIRRNRLYIGEIRSNLHKNS